ncbi:hypothetical protein RSAG8_09222, partial [Rhizoctonia solani AG-8 WAC10335]
MVEPGLFRVRSLPFESHTTGGSTVVDIRFSAICQCRGPISQMPIRRTFSPLAKSCDHSENFRE